MRAMIDDIELPDDSTRPTGPKFDDLTIEQRAPGRHLQMIHNHFRENMQVLRDMIEQAQAGTIGAEELNARAGAMPMLENYRRFGALCGQHCQIIHTHHSIEDQAIFPHLSDKAEAFRRVVERLMAEHEIVHELLVRLIDALNALLQDPGPDNFETTREIYETLEKLLISHFGYEEEEIGDALGYYGIGI